MCAPAILPVAAGALGVGGATAAGVTSTAALAATGIQTAAMGLQAKANIETAEYNAAVAEQQAQQLETQAEHARIAGSQEAQQARIESERVAARNRAQFAGGGVSTITGTPGQVGEDVSAVGRMDEMTIINNANRQAMGFETQAQNLLSSAEMQKSRARTGAFTTLLTAPATGFMRGFQ